MIVFEPCFECLHWIELSSVGNPLAKRWLLREVRIFLKNKRLRPSRRQASCPALLMPGFPTLSVCVLYQLGPGVKERASLPGSLFVPRGGCGKKHGIILGFWLSHAGQAASRDRQCRRKDRGEGTCTPGLRCSRGKAWCGACSSLLLNGIL